MAGLLGGAQRSTLRLGLQLLIHGAERAALSERAAPFRPLGDEAGERRAEVDLVPFELRPVRPATRGCVRRGRVASLAARHRLVGLFASRRRCAIDGDAGQRAENAAAPGLARNVGGALFPAAGLSPKRGRHSGRRPRRVARKVLSLLERLGRVLTG